jgi:hypothetical protein
MGRLEPWVSLVIPGRSGTIEAMTVSRESAHVPRALCVASGSD